MRFIGSHLLQSLAAVALGLLLIALAESIIAVDIARTLLGVKASLGEVNALRQQLGLDLPFFERVANRIWNALHGDLGESYVFRQPVAPLVFEALRHSLRLVIPALTIGATAGVVIGIWAAYSPSAGRRIVLAAFSALALLPTLVLSTLAVYAIAYKLGWGDSSELTAIGILALGPVALTALGARDQYFAILNSDHIRAARSLGFPEWRIATRLAFKVASVALISLLTTLLISLMMGTMFVEITFAMPGLGSLLLVATERLDYPIVMGIVVVFVVSFGLMNLLSGVALYGLDPRTR